MTPKQNNTMKAKNPSHACDHTLQFHEKEPFNLAPTFAVFSLINSNLINTKPHSLIPNPRLINN